MQTNAVTFGGNQQCQKRNEDLVYCTAVFTRQKGGKAERRNATAKDETIYSDANEDLVYSTPVFTRRKGGKAGRRNATAKDETIYTDLQLQRYSHVWSSFLCDDPESHRVYPPYKKYIRICKCTLDRWEVY
ncbi:hypothetical protein Q8A73_011061 [Channa argus]|nr:hypothetical protein Q8A73_011061 [Channa argus]